MKTNKILKTAGVLCLFLFIGSKSFAQTNVEVGINLPYSGNYNYWTITFSDNNGNSYTFYTDNNSFNSHVLGTIPAGTYNIDFSCSYWGSEGFDIGVCGPNYYHFNSSHTSDFTWYSAVIEDGTYIQIDEGY